MEEEEDRARADRLLHWLCLAGIACYFLISAFYIHSWRVPHWRAFDAGFAALAAQHFGSPRQPLWLYAVALPFIALNFGCLVQILRGKRRGIVALFILSMAVVAIIPLIGLQHVIHRSVWAEILFLAGYAIGGGVSVILAFRLDSHSLAIIDAPDLKD
ncbi:hypothetical protein [Porphyrobacter sp. GA68]|uniref:hypothetical protein n=1 Tax=Porphyrobacter sp. GA68 TaxID=2883480 RepID=UPI001D18FE97|nr:hypothetical protein [Porphyrobacter sp. GA68]